MTVLLRAQWPAPGINVPEAATGVENPIKELNEPRYAKTSLFAVSFEKCE